ncbi:MAG: SH3 domain-containing protein [Chloroflexi bacterium]|nr:SH3 domain-containing protein [Chloroflexota bacterium]
MNCTGHRSGSTAFVLLTAILFGAFLFGVSVTSRSPAVASTSAQELPEGEWWAWTYVPATDMLYLINDSGEQAAIPRPRLPDEIAPEISSPQISISPDSRFMTIAAELENGNTGLGFFDIQAREFLQIHQAAPGEDVILATERPFAGSRNAYDADGERLAIGFATASDQSWRVIIFEVATGDSLNVFDYTNPSLEALDFSELIPPVYPKIVYFADDTVHTQFIEYGQPLGAENPAFAWDLDDDVAADSPYTRSRLDVLPDEGTMVFTYVDPETDTVELAAGAPVTAFNAIGTGLDSVDVPLRQSADQIHWQVEWAAGGTLVLFSASPTPLDPPQWHALNLETGAESGLDPTITTAAGLPEGFISLDQSGVLAFHPLDDPVESTVIWEAPGGNEPVILWSSPAETAFGLEEIPPTPDAVVSVEQLEIRRDPGYGSQVVVTVPFNTGLRLTGRLADNTWVQVEAPDGELGWVFARSVRLHEALDEVPVINTAIIAPPSPTPLPPTAQPLPTIAFFVADTYQVRPAECVTISWSVANAERVVLRTTSASTSTLEEVPLTGSALKCPPDNPTNYTLEATSNSGTISQVILVLVDPSY